MENSLVIGSRGSKLALIQANTAKNQIHLLDSPPQVSIAVIKTSGDTNSAPLSAIGGKGVFTKELEDALLDRRIDLAVHSLKDLPTTLPEGLAIAAICKREDPRDALILPRGKSVPSLATLRQGAIIGTSSPRRMAQLQHLRPDLRFRELRGNVDTRLRKLDEGQYDALLLACAGLRRLGLDDRITVALTTQELLPAVGQGALAIEVRADDEATTSVVTKLDHKFTRVACLAERSLLRALGGGCLLPIAAHAVVRDKRIMLEGLVADRSGNQIVRRRLKGPLTEPEELGIQLANELLESGARELLASDAMVNG